MNEVKYTNGVLFGRGEYDWQFGGNSPIQHDILVPDKNWKIFPVAHETQWTGVYDTQFCVTYSALKTIAKFLTYLESVGALSQEDLLFFSQYKKDGMYDFSERFPATLGETTIHGAYQYKIANAIKNFGLIPQDMFPLADNFQDNINPEFITEEMYAKGREFLERVSVNYEWIDSFDNLIYSPIQAIVKFANYENPEDILSPEGSLNHAVTGVYGVVEYNEIEDTYWQEFKRYHPDYTKSLLAYFITINNNTSMDITKWLTDNDKNQVRNTTNGAYGVVYGGKLMEIKAERAGLYMIDRDARGLIGKGKTVNINNNEWQQIKDAGYIINF
jgi:hypothetical protein